MFRRKSIATLAAGLLSVAALAAGCASTPLSDVHQILSNAVTAMSPANVVDAGTSSATTSPGNLQSVHFIIDAGGQLNFGIEAATPTPAPSDTPVPSAADTSSPPASPSSGASQSAAASGSQPVGPSQSASVLPSVLPS
ncbi:MAG TPA: hypothetical protein VJ258_00495, partial [Candidatus Limnocylindrales bacterium]|nr:hypothetical protein [Candidatus Limnocylindrales bacterium]